MVGSQVSYIGIVIPSSVGMFGVDIDYFSSGEMEITTLQEQDGTRRFFDASDMMLGLTYSKLMTDRFPYLKGHWFFKSKIGTIVSIFVTQYFVFLAWIPFRARDTNDTKTLRAAFSSVIATSTSLGGGGLSESGEVTGGLVAGSRGFSII